MKTFERDFKYNFVDENNVFVGFDAGWKCCENFGYYFSSSSEINVNLDFDTLPNEEDYVFDTNFFEEKDDDDGYGKHFAIFKLINNKNGECVYLHLYNSHNGHYSHGFTCQVGGQVLHSGRL